MYGIIMKWDTLKLRLQHMRTCKRLSVYKHVMMSIETEIQNIKVLVDIMLALSVGIEVTEKGEQYQM